MSDFEGLPRVTGLLIQKHAKGLYGCLSESRLWGHDGVLDTVSPIARGRREFPFTSLENAFDFNRRYARVQGILSYAGLKPRERLLILCDAENVYFASDLEDVLTEWEVAILIRDDLAAQELKSQMSELEPNSVMLVTRRPFDFETIPRSCRSVLTFMNRHRPPVANRFACTDVYSCNLLPWMAARRTPTTTYRTNEVYLHNGLRPQVFIERDRTAQLLLTTLVEQEKGPLIPLVRFVTGGRVGEVVRSRFEILE